MKLGNINFFEVYKLRDLTDSQISDIKMFTDNMEDIGKRLARKIVEGGVFGGLWKSQKNNIISRKLDKICHIE